MSERIPEVVAMILEQLRAFVEGDELALSDLSDALDRSDYDSDDVDAAFDFIFQALEPVSHEMYTESRPGAPSIRVLSDGERLALSPEAQGYLLRLRESGVLTDDQIEIVLEHATASRQPKMGIDEVRDIAGDVVFGQHEKRFIHEGPDTRQ
jgi:uncharacterized protein Smg (DUF494 family)